jgi:hypothetical protein
MARKTLDKWIDEAIADPMKEKITAISLIHMQGNAHKEIYTYKFSPASTVTSKELAELFRDKAKTYCQDLTGPQTYQLFAFYGGIVGEPGARHPFVERPESEQSNGLNTEAATNEGALQQTMRHKEAGMAQIFTQQSNLNNFANAMLAQQGDMLTRMGNHIQKLQVDNMSAFEVVKDLMMKMVEQNFNRDMQKLAYERSSKEREKWLSFAPPLVNRLLGQEIFPENVEDTALMEAIADNLTPEHLTMLQLLPETIRGPLAARIEKHMQKKEQQKEAMRALPHYNGSAEDDVTGGTH